MDRRLLVLALGMFALGTDSFVVAGILPQVSRGFDISIGAAGQMTTVYAISYALLSPTVAALAAGVPRKRLLLVALAVFVIANFGTAAAPTFGIALATRALAGLGAAMFAPTATGVATLLVPPERRGLALSVVATGLTSATALGAPIGTVIGAAGDWRWTLVFVGLLGTAAGFGVALLLKELPLPPQVTLGQRLAPLADKRIVSTLATTTLAMSGIFTVYTYFAVVFDRATGESAVVLGALLVLWGTCGTLSNLSAGRLIDSVGSRQVLLTMLTILTIAIALTPWAGEWIWTAAPVIAVWGACGWGVLVPQQYRLVGLAPSIAPIVLGLNTASTYVGVSTAGVVGAAGIEAVGAHNLGFLGATLIGLALVVSEFAARKWPLSPGLKSAGS